MTLSHDVASSVVERMGVLAAVDPLQLKVVVSLPNNFYIRIELQICLYPF